MTTIHELRDMHNGTTFTDITGTSHTCADIIRWETDGPTIVVAYGSAGAKMYFDITNVMWTTVAPDMHVDITNPDNNDDMPIYSGPVANAHHNIVPGTYTGTTYDDDAIIITVFITHTTAVYDTGR